MSEGIEEEGPDEDFPYCQDDIVDGKGIQEDLGRPLFGKPGDEYEDSLDSASRDQYNETFLDSSGGRHLAILQMMLDECRTSDVVYRDRMVDL